MLWAYNTVKHAHMAGTVPQALAVFPMSVSSKPALPKTLTMTTLVMRLSSAPNLTANEPSTVDLSMPGMPMSPNDSPATAVKGFTNTYTANVVFTMPGQWLVTLTVRSTANHIVAGQASIDVR